MNATERVRSILDRQIAVALAANEQDHIGGRHWQVTEAEIEVFMLPPKTAAKLWLVWEAYENALGISTDMGNTALFAGLRDEHPFLAHAMRGGDEGYDAPFISPESFAEFGALFGIDQRSCIAWFWKWSFMDRRMVKAAKRMMA